MVFTNEWFLEAAVASWPHKDFNTQPLNSIQTVYLKALSGHCVKLALRANFVQLLQFHLFVQCWRFISVFAFVSHHIWFKQSVSRVIMLVAEWIDTYNVHHKRIFRNSYRKLVWVEFETTITEFRSDTLTEWALRLLTSTHSQSELSRDTPVSSFCSVFTLYLIFCLRQQPHLL